MRGGRQEKSRIIAVGERSVRNFFSEHHMATTPPRWPTAASSDSSRSCSSWSCSRARSASPTRSTRLWSTLTSEASKHVPQQLQPVIQQGRKQIQPLQGMIDNAQKQAGGDLLFFGVAVAMWSVSAVARTLTEAFNVAYQVAETRRLWKRLALSLFFGPVLALMAIASVALMLVGTQLVGNIAKAVGLGDLFVSLWGWLRFPVALLLLAVVLCVVYRVGPNVKQGLSVGGCGRGACPGAVGDLLCRFFFLPCQLRRLRRHLRDSVQP